MDVKDGLVVKGVRFRNHKVVGDILQLAERYSNQGADELVFYDITASPEDRSVDRSWVNRIAEKINIPFCVAGGIRFATWSQKFRGGARAGKTQLNSVVKSIGSSYRCNNGSISLCSKRTRFRALGSRISYQFGNSS